MSFIGVSPTDLIKAIETALFIKRTWFDKANRANSLYSDFVDDIANLSSSLEDLKAAFRAGYDKSVRDLRYLDPRNQAVDRDRRAIVGDIEATLQACVKLLQENTTVDREGISFIRNALFHAIVLPNIEALRERLKFHMIKMRFVLEPLQLGLLRDIHQDNQILVETVGDLHAHVIHGTPVTELRCPPISSALRARFEEAFIKDQPSTLSNDRFVEVVFDALHRVFLVSTFAYHGPAFGRQTVRQFLNLRKAQFLLEKLQEDDGLLHRYYYLRSSRILHCQIRGEYKRKQVTQYPDDVLEKEAAELFQIWDPSAPPELTQRGNQVKSGVPAQEILDIPLLPDGGEPFNHLVIFRQDHDYHNFRLLRKAPATAATAAWNDSSSFSLRDYAYIPWNSVPDRPEPLNQVQLHNRMSGESVTLAFKEVEDLLKFQHAIMGYRVVGDKTGFTWLFQREEIGQNLDRQQNRIQLWLPHRLDPRKKRKGSSQNGSTTASPGSRSLTASTVATSFQSLPSLPVGKIRRTSTIASPIVVPESQTEGWQETTSIRALLDPVLFLFTMLDKKYTFVGIPLTVEHHLSYQCSCPSKRHICTNVAVKMGQDSKEREFAFRIYQVKTNQVAQWDLAQFANPRHPNFHKLKVRHTSYLDLYFGSTEDRIDFAKRFNKLVGDHRQNHQTNAELTEQHMHQSDRPPGATSMKSTLDRSASLSSDFCSRRSSSSRGSSLSSAPRLDPFPPLTPLSMPMPYRDNIDEV